MIKKSRKAKTIKLAYLPGDEVWIKGQDRVCIIDNISINKNDVGNLQVIYEWCNFDYGPDLIEVWDNGYFTDEDVDKITFKSFSEFEQARELTYEIS